MRLDSYNFKNTISKQYSKLKKNLGTFITWFFSTLGLKSKSIFHHQVNLDKKLVYSFSKSRIPTIQQFKYLKNFLNKKELLIFRSCLIVITMSLLFLGGRFYFKHLEILPEVGGDYTEGVVGTPKYINPMYASVSDVDSDLSILVYSSLFRRDENGYLANDLAESFAVAPDGKTYTVKIKSGVKYHNGQLLNVDDILFTFNAIKDGEYKSPLRIAFTGVSIEKIDEQTIKFILSEPYAAFAELLTFGILPQELWYQLAPSSASLAELNLKPIGSGPYKFKSLVKDKSGNIKSYNLVINENYYGEKPFIKNLHFKFFPNYEELTAALNDSLLDGISYVPAQFLSTVANKSYLNYYRLNFPQLMAIFFNQKTNSALVEPKIRQALALAINKNDIVDKVLAGGARIIDGPILPESFAYNSQIKKYSYNQIEAKKLIESADYKLNVITPEIFAKAIIDEKNATDESIKQEARMILNQGQGSWYVKKGKYLSVKLTTVDSGENPSVVEAVKIYWESIGVKTNIELIAPSKIQTDVIKVRDYEALFYGQLSGADPDPYPFWHSSQSGAVGLNLAGYYDKKVDKLLEDARLSVNFQTRKENYIKFQEIISVDAPAIFIYSPYYIYVQDKKIKNFNTKNIAAPSDRLASIFKWYINVGKKIKW